MPLTHPPPPPRQQQRNQITQKAAADDVASARQWIGAWKDKNAAAANRASWFPGTKLPAHLDGSLPADFGFDPLGLGVESDKLKW